MIRVPEVRLIKADGEQVGIVPIEQALKMAGEASLDLVEVAPMAKPPVCKIIDQGKVLFDQRLRQRAQKKKQHVTEVKEIKMKLKIDKHDYETKIRLAKKFLEHSDKAKFSILFRGREITHQDIGRELSDRVLADMKEIGELEGQVSRTGRLHTFLVARRKDYKPKAADKKKERGGVAEGEAAPLAGAATAMADGSDGSDGSTPAPQAEQDTPPKAVAAPPRPGLGELEILAGGEEAAILP